eukprot:scaffold441930_cov25-Prasinocladus_malaysianus.AAC.1
MAVEVDADLQAEAATIIVLQVVSGFANAVATGEEGNPGLAARFRGFRVLLDDLAFPADEVANPAAGVH